MTRFRKQDRQSNQADLAEQEPTVFLIEDSIALGILLKNRIEEVSPANVQLYRTLAHATAALQENRPTLAITGLNLPDAPDGEMLDVLAEYGVPTILFTATFDRKVRERFASAKLVDYFVKDTVDAVDQLVRTVVRLTGAGSTAILVVDDTLSVRAALVDLLQRQKYQVFDAGSGTDALKILSANPQIRLVITDFHMPDMDGQQLTREIRQTYSTEDLRVIGVSSSSDPFLSAALLKAGASDFVYRPYIAEEVLCRVENNIDTIKQMKRLRHLAERDPLTGLYNRRAFFERAYKILDGLKAGNAPGSLAILDIDHFKTVNDTYGHDCGDVALNAVANVLLTTAQERGFLTARLGGEEFVMMFHHRDSTQVFALCEDIRQAIEACDVRSEEAPIALTASIGVSVIHLEEGMDNLLNAADQMLYLAKLQGRNRVISDAQFCDA